MKEEVWTPGAVSERNNLWAQANRVALAEQPAVNAATQGRPFNMATWPQERGRSACPGRKEPNRDARLKMEEGGRLDKHAHFLNVAQLQWLRKRSFYSFKLRPWGMCIYIRKWALSVKMRHWKQVTLWSLQTHAGQMKELNLHLVIIKAESCLSIFDIQRWNVPAFMKESNSGLTFGCLQIVTVLIALIAGLQLTRTQHVCIFCDCLLLL